ncbi:MAG: FAD:protein FMN transferase [Bacteroidaceae bacterium]|nr:FAD:protein FMN transferase [Bacteroidaceae bacterium]
MSTPNPQSSRLKQILAATFLLFLIVGTVWIVRRHAGQAWQTNEGPVFGTFFHIQYQCDEDLQPLIQAELIRLDSTLSLFNNQSLLSRLNRGETQQTDTLFRSVFAIARTVSQATGGAFDITVAPLVKAWGFGPDGTPQAPSVQTLDSLRQVVGFSKLRLQGEQLLKSDPRVQIDLGAIAKGFAVDRIAAVLRAHKVENFMVEIGGEIVAQGTNPEGKPWTVGIVKPTTEDATAGLVQQVLSLGTGAMATSGNYLNFHKQGRKRIGHTIDPRTGQPVQRNILSATVLAPNCATADAFATAFMVLGLDSARKVVESHKELEAYLIYEDAKGQHRVWQSPAVAAMHQ